MLVAKKKRKMEEGAEASQTRLAVSLKAEAVEAEMVRGQQDTPHMMDEGVSSSWAYHVFSFQVVETDVEVQPLDEEMARYPQEGRASSAALDSIRVEALDLLASQKPGWQPIFHMMTGPSSDMKRAFLDHLMTAQRCTRTRSILHQGVSSQCH